MNTLLNKLYLNNKNQSYVFLLVSILNVITIGVFIKLIYEISQIRNEMIAISKDETLTMYFTMLIVISIVIIFFSLWVLMIVSQTMFNARKEFNIQVRLFGLTRVNLSKIYILESLRYQMIAIPIGSILMELAYYGISHILQISSHWIGIPLMVASIFIHLVSVIVCMALTLRKITKFDPVEELRSPYKVEKIRKLTKNDSIIGISGMILMVIGKVAGADNSFFSILPFIGIFMLFDLVIVGTQYILKWVSDKLHFLSLNLSQRNLVGYYKKVNPIFTTLIVGVMVSMGLIGMFKTIRTISKETVEQNMYFNYLVINSDVKENKTQEEYQKFVYSVDPSAEVAYGINLEMEDKEEVTNTIFAIDSNYMKYGEKIELSNGMNPDENLNDPDFDGIYLPDYFISEKEIGKNYQLNLGKNKVTFKITGRFIANGSRGRYGFVSKKYLQNQMGLDMINAFYIHKGSETLLRKMKSDPNVLENYVISKKNIANNSYNNAINGVEIFEIAAFTVILISVLMLIHFYVSNSNQNVFDISRLRVMGVKSKILKRMYVLQTFNIITQSFVVGIVLAYLFISTGINMTLEYVRVPVRAELPLTIILVTYIIVVSISCLVTYLTIRKAFKSNVLSFITVSD